MKFCSIIIFLLLSNPIFSNCNINHREYAFSNITLKIRGIGNKEIFSSDSEHFSTNNYPNIVYINGDSQNKINHTYYFNQTNNTVLLVWNDNINTSEYMFSKCIDITEIDLSNFDTSEITRMRYMFRGCSSLISLDLSNFKTSKVERMEYMFYNCSSLTSLDLYNFNTSKVNHMEYMFGNCSSLISLDLSNFDISAVTYMHSMFNGCSSLISLNLTNFNTSNVIRMELLFVNCASLTSLDLSYFNTSKVINMHYMFRGCSSLTSLNISNFDTSNVHRMEYMFKLCSSLISLDLSNFNTSLMNITDNMFEGCTSLEYINLENFNDINLKSSKNMFKGLRDNIVICIKNNNSIISTLSNKKCFINDCSDNWKIAQKKIIDDFNICIDNCDEHEDYKYEYNGKCYKNCSNGYIIDNNNNITKCKCELEKCLFCTNLSFKNNLCTKCNNDYYPMEDDPSNFGEYINCYKDLKGYYLDENEFVYKKCYYTCETCKMKGDNITNNCLTCKENYTCGIYYINEISTFLYASDKTDTFGNYSYIIYDSVLNTDYNNTIESNEINKSNIISIISYIDTNITIPFDNYYNINNMLKEINKNISKDEEIKYYDEILEKIELGFTSKDFDTSNIDKGKDEIIENEKVKISLTTVQNQKNNVNYNISRIDLGECEYILREYYNISNNTTLYMKKIDVKQEGYKIPKIEFDVYCKLSGLNLEKLNLSICENTKINIYIPIDISENLDKFNSSSGYYNDICYTTTSESGTDISLKDRKNEFITQNRTTCQDGCDFSEYDYTTKSAKCSCNVKESSSSIANIIINKNKLFESFIDFKNIANINILRCYKTLFSIQGITKNIGFYIIIIIILIHTINIIIFYICQISMIKKTIKKIIFGIKHLNFLDKKENK